MPGEDTRRAGPIGRAGIRCAAVKRRKKRGCFNSSLFFYLMLRYQTAQTAFWELIFTPGPMVEAVTQLLTYWPFADAGFALMMAEISVL